MDLDAHVSSLLNSSSTSTVQRNTSSYKAATRTFPRVSATPNQWDYKNIIEKLQVQLRLAGGSWPCSVSPVSPGSEGGAVACRTSSTPWRIA